MEYEEFDFDKALKQGQNLAKLQWFKLHKDRFVSENYFVKEIKKLKPLSPAKHQGRGYCPSKLKQDYKVLRERFGFFK